MKRFVDRADAGRRLAQRLGHLRRDAVVVVGLPRGGVPVAVEVARALGAPLDIILVRKLGVPFQTELAMGAIGEDGVRVVNDDIVRRCDVTAAELEQVEARERTELERRAARFRRGKAPVPLAGKTVVVVDDGIATGSTAMAACAVARAHGATRVVLAAPVAPPEVADRIGGSADELVLLHTPGSFFAVGQFYSNFDQTTDEEVVEYLERGHQSSSSQGQTNDEVDLDVDGSLLGGHLTVPIDARGLVLFAHGSGSSRHSRRNQFVAGVLHEVGIATLLFDLLTTDEERRRANVFDVTKLGHRLATATTWARERPELDGLQLGYFGASTGAAAALWAAAEPEAHVAAIVSRGGRPDLAGDRLPLVKAPTRLVVGGEDREVLELNKLAAARMTCQHDLVIVPGATHLFEERDTLKEASETAREWFVEHLAAPR